jgi:hypothetical protein
VTTRRQALKWTAGGSAALAGAMLTQGLRGANDASAQTTSKAVGAWMVTFPDNGGSGGDDPNEHEMIILNSDGTVIATNAPTTPPDPQGGPQVRTYSSPSMGAWTTTSSGQLRIVMNTIDYDDQGHFVDLVQITVHLTGDGSGNSFTGGFSVQVTDASGAVLFDSQGDVGTVQGTRITA